MKQALIILSVLVTLLSSFTEALCAEEIRSQIDEETFSYLQGDFNANAPEYLQKYRDTWTYVRYPVRKQQLGGGKHVVFDNIRMAVTNNRSKVHWGAGAIDPSAVKNVYLMFNSFLLDAAKETESMDTDSPINRASAALLDKVAPLYTRTKFNATSAEPLQQRMEAMQMFVGHAQVYFEFEAGACVLGNGEGKVEATPGIILSLDAIGRRYSPYDPFAGMDYNTYDALYNIVDIRDALVWSSQFDTSTTFFRLKFSQEKKRALLERMLGVAFNEQPLMELETGKEVTISEYRYHTLFQACINTSVRLVNEQFPPDNCLPVFFNICDGMPQRERSDNDICTLFDEMRLPSAETSVFGVVGNALVQRGLAEKVNSYPSTIKKMIAESDKIDIHPAYPDYQITRPSMADGNEPSFELGLNMTSQ